MTKPASQCPTCNSRERERNWKPKGPSGILRCENSWHDDSTPSVETPAPEPTYCEGCEKHLDRIFGNNEWIHVENYGGGTSECLNPPTPASMQDVPPKDSGTLADLALFLDMLLAAMQNGSCSPDDLAGIRSRLQSKFQETFND